MENDLRAALLGDLINDQPKTEFLTRPDVEAQLPSGLPRIRSRMHESDEETEISTEGGSGLDHLFVEAEKKKYASLPSTVFNLLSSLLGAGILSVPNTFVNTGVIMSIVMLLFIGFLSWIATVITISLERRKKATDFPELTFIVLGKTGSVIYSILALLFLFTCQLAYLIVGGNCIISWFGLGGIQITGLWLRAAVICVYSCLIPIALTLPRNISFLSYLSMVTFILICFFAASLIYEGSNFLVKNKNIDKDVRIWKCDMSLFNSLSIYALSYALPVVCSPILNLYRPETTYRSLAAFIAILIVFLLSAVPSLFAYFQFGDDIKDNILDTYPENNILIIIVKGAFFFIVNTAYPLVSQSVMSSWSQLIFKDTAANKLPFGRRSIILALTNIIPLLCAMFLESAKPALSVGGAIGGCITNFVFPAIMWLKCSEHKLWFWRNILCLLFAIFGIVAGAISTYLAILGAIDAFSK